jgi:hypothetical protein
VRFLPTLAANATRPLEHLWNFVGRKRSASLRACYRPCSVRSQVAAGKQSNHPLVRLAYVLSSL